MRQQQLQQCQGISVEPISVRQQYQPLSSVGPSSSYSLATLSDAPPRLVAFYD